MEDSNYLECLQEIIAIHEHLDSEPGMWQAKVDAWLVDPEISLLLDELVGRNGSRRNTWQSSCCSRVTQGNTDHLSMTQRTSTPEGKMDTPKHQDSGVAFAQEEEDNTPTGTPRGTSHGGRCGGRCGSTHWGAGHGRLQGSPSHGAKQ